jgi:hypothetical protein
MKMKLAIGISGICLGISLLFNTTLAEEATPPTPPEIAPASPPSDKTVSLETIVANYMNAWQKQDFKTMRRYESWEGGAELGEVQYIQAFDAHFKIHNWKITKSEAVSNDEYKVLVLMDHNPPKQVAGFLPPDRESVRSTRIQWWKKQGDKFVHLYHIERQRFMQLFFPTQHLAPAAPSK